MKVGMQLDGTSLVDLAEMVTVPEKENSSVELDNF